MSNQLYVKLDYSQNNENKKVYKGFLNTNTLVFTSDTGKKFTLHKNYEKYLYKYRIVFVNNDKNKPQEWIFQLIPNKNILDKLGLNPMEEETEMEKQSETEESDPDYNPDEESEEDSECEYEDYEEDDDDY